LPIDHAQGVVPLQRRDSFQKIIQEVEDFLENKSNSTAAVAGNNPEDKEDKI